MFGPALILTLAANVASAVVVPRAPLKVVQCNDDGWAVANIRRLFDALDSNGFSTMISAPARQRSGSGSLDATPTLKMILAGDFGLLPAGSPSIGSNSSDPRIGWVDSYPVTAVKNGIKLAPTILGGSPDLVVTGPNVGSNLGLITQFSGTIGAATEALKQGIPAIGISAAGGSQHVFTEADPVADVYAQVSLKLIQAITSAGKPFLPSGTALNVNLPKADATTCTSVDDYEFYLTRVNFDINPFTPDVQHCGTDHLPTESSVAKLGGCPVTISVFQDWKLDANAAEQKVVRDKIANILTCPPK